MNAPTATNAAHETLATIAAIQWDRSYLTDSEHKAIREIGNPFRLDRLFRERDAIRVVRDLDRRDWQGETRKCASLFDKTDALPSAIRGLELCTEAEIATEACKPRVARLHSLKTKGQDDGWRIVVVLTGEASALFPTDLACAELWFSWGFDPAESRCYADYSPTGQMFQRALSVRRCANGCAILSQSGARDV